MAKILDTSLEEIYEPLDGIYIINNSKENENFGNYHNYAHSDFVLETLKKYIIKLEEENTHLREENIQLKGK